MNLSKFGGPDLVGLQAHLAASVTGTQDLNIPIVNAATGELTLDPIRGYQPTGAPKGPKRRKLRT